MSAADPAFAEWRDRLIRLGRIVPLDHPDVNPEQAEADCEEYYRMVDAIDPATADPRVLDALLASIRVDIDYEVYQRTFAVAFAFPPHLVGAAAFAALERIRREAPTQARDLVERVADNFDVAWSFNDAWRAAIDRGEDTSDLLAWIEQEEQYGGALEEDRSGILRPSRSGLVES